VVVAAERFRDQEQYNDTQCVGERQHEQHVGVVEVLGRVDQAGGSVALRGAQSPCVLKVIRATARKVTDAERGGDERQTNEDHARSENVDHVGQVADQGRADHDVQGIVAQLADPGLHCPGKRFTGF